MTEKVVDAWYFWINIDDWTIIGRHRDPPVEEDVSVASLGFVLVHSTRCGDVIKKIPELKSVEKCAEACKNEVSIAIMAEKV